MYISMLRPQSTLQALGIPNEVGVLLFSLGLVLSFTLVFAGADFGFLKVPAPDHRKRLWFGTGVLLLACSIGSFLPLWGRADVEAAAPAFQGPPVMGSMPADSPASPQVLASSPHVALEYVRLFGAYQVPWILDMMESGDVYTGDMADYSVCRREDSGFNPSCIAPLIRDSRTAVPLARWWASWPAHDAILFASHVATCKAGSELALECPGIYEADPDILSNQWVTTLGYYPSYFVWLACDDDRECRRTMVQIHEWGEEYEYDLSGLPPEADAIHALLADEDRAQRMIDRASSRIGFLFLLLRNDSDVRLEDFQLEFAWHRLPPRPFPAGFDPALALIDPLEGMPGPELVEGALDTAAVLVRGLANLMPGQEILWLLSIYRRDAQGFPARYVSSVVRPLRLTYRVPGQVQRMGMDIRAPLGDMAIRDNLPSDHGLWMGWRGQ